VYNVNIPDGSMSTVKKTTGTLVGARKEVGPEVSAEEIEWMLYFVTRMQNRICLQFCDIETVLGKPSCIYTLHNTMYTEEFLVVKMF
jgi:hypothetical protein